MFDDRPATRAEEVVHFSKTEHGSHEKGRCLLDSPHYGERVAAGAGPGRYADSNGYQVDNTRSIWPYRHRVIKVLTTCRSTVHIEQLAGDLLPNATSKKNRDGFQPEPKLNDEGGGDAEEYR